MVAGASASRSKPQVVIHLRKDLTRDIKRGHVWLFGDAIDHPRAPSGSTAIVLDRRGQKIASGMYDPEHPIPLRICRTQPPWDLDTAWLEKTLSEAQQLRRGAFDSQTTGYRLVNGEGDRLPGLVIDIYSQVAVIKLDGGAPQHFYDLAFLADWLTRHLGCSTIMDRPRGRGTEGRCILGPVPEQSIAFLENGLHFTADVIRGQKTGFFLDQRDNRGLVRRFARGRSVLNLFSFSGGFSVAAGVGGCRQAISVDCAPAAIEAAEQHWALNGLDPTCHHGVVADVFEYLEKATQRQTWDLVICDPPSFAPSERAKGMAEEAYQRLAQLSAKVVAPGGLLALASCSSHMPAEEFSELNLAGIGRARRLATLLASTGLPVDHPVPLAMPELSYLKFQLLQLNG